jgi:hypothetical protein
LVATDPPLHKPDEKYDPEVKRQNEMVRRWNVEIFQVEIVNLTSEIMDSFMQIIIGGDYFVTKFHLSNCIGRVEKVIRGHNSVPRARSKRHNLLDGCSAAR